MNNSTETKLKALLVEDNAENRDVITYFVRNVCSVDAASDAPTALQMVSEKQYDVILMDINLGLGMNGMEATKRIRELQGYSLTPIIAVTAYAMVGDRETFLKNGCSAYISKPFTKQEILDLILSVVQKPS